MTNEVKINAGYMYGHPDRAQPTVTAPTTQFA
jgi:hypothetical protein